MRQLNGNHLVSLSCLKNLYKFSQVTLKVRYFMSIYCLTKESLQVRLSIEKIFIYIPEAIIQKYVRKLTKLLFIVLMLQMQSTLAR